MKHTFHGTNYRVLLVVTESTGAPPSFRLRVLDNRAAANVSFRLSGTVVYDGTDSDRALRELLVRVPDADRKMPPKIKRVFRLK